MYYEINVSKNAGKDWTGREIRYVHFFATHQRSIVDEAKAREVYAEMVKAFPSPEFKVEVMRHESFGELVKF